jgi:hypothetical protein
MPALPDDVEPLGDALYITATHEPTLPVTLRLPVPPGVTDPENLAILRVEEDGNTTFLMTRVANNELLAETLGFSTYVRVRVDRSWSASMVGNESLHTGQQSTYLFNSSHPAATVAFWRASGMATLVDHGDRMATVRAGSESGHAWLWYLVDEPAAAVRWEGWKGIVIVDPALDPESFGVAVVARPSVAHIGRDTVSIVATAQGDYEAPIWWAWQFQAGGGGQAQTDSGTLELPTGTYPPQDQPGIYIFRIWAEDAQHRVSESWGGYELLPAEPFRVSVSGPTEVRWSDPAAFEGYTASASGGQPPYGFRLQLFPGADPSRPISFSLTASDTATVKFDQPGAYRLQVYAIDKQEEVAETSLIIVVEGGEPLSTRIVELPATAAVDDDVVATISIRGGVLVAGAKKAGYRLIVDWGDGSAPLVEEDVGLKITPYQGIVFSRSHSYAAERQYTVRIQAFDATGKSDWYTQEITVSRSPAKDPDTTTTQPMPMDLPAKYLGPYTIVEPCGTKSGEIELTLLSDGSIRMAMKALRSSCPGPYVAEDGTVRFPKWTSYPPDVVKGTHGDGSFVLEYGPNLRITGTYDAQAMQGRGQQTGDYPITWEISGARIPMSQQRQ